jgi:hypothetical protein
MELIDLLPPKERLGEVYRKFVSRLEKKLAEDEKRLDETFETHRTMLHRSHEKTIRSYQTIFNKMVEKLDSQEDIPLVTFFEKALRSKNISLYSKAAENLLPNLDNVEKNGGSLVFSSKITDEGYITRNYYGFMDDFWGIDDDIVFKVKKEYVSRFYKEEEANANANANSDIQKKEPSVQEDIDALLAAAALYPQPLNLPLPFTDK